MSSTVPFLRAGPGVTRGRGVDAETNSEGRNFWPDPDDDFFSSVTSFSLSQPGFFLSASLPGPATAGEISPVPPNDKLLATKISCGQSNRIINYNRRIIYQKYLTIPVWIVHLDGQ